jgi:hypothetical protein
MHGKRFTLGKIATQAPQSANFSQNAAPHCAKFEQAVVFPELQHWAGSGLKPRG